MAEIENAGDWATLQVCGRINRKPELRQTPEGVPATTLAITCTMDGEPFYWDFHLFGARAEEAVATMPQGSTVFVVGRPEKKRWFSKSGEPLQRITYKAKEVRLIQAGCP